MPASVGHHVTESSSPQAFPGPKWTMTPEVSCELTLSGVKRDLTPKLMQPMSARCLGEEQRVSLLLSVQGSLLEVFHSVHVAAEGTSTCFCSFVSHFVRWADEFYSVSPGKHRAWLVLFPKSQSS